MFANNHSSNSVRVFEIPPLNSVATSVAVILSAITSILFIERLQVWVDLLVDDIEEKPIIP